MKHIWKIFNWILSTFYGKKWIQILMALFLFVVYIKIQGVRVCEYVQETYIFILIQKT